MKRACWIVLLGLFVSLGGHPAQAGEEDTGMAAWPPNDGAAQRALETALNQVPSVERLRAWHDQFCAEPHPAGSEGDARLIQKMVAAFETMGLETKRHDLWAYMPTFESAELSVAKGQVVVPLLPLREQAVAEDASVKRQEDIPAAFNAYSATGLAAGEVVYVNYGTKEDFEQLEKFDFRCSCEGKIVIARYGRNYRGFKAKYAEAAGAAGLLLYTDPADSGYGKGLPYPEGGYANASSIQRGSIKTLAYPGDPLTPGAEATEEAERLDPKDLALPKIPVQPIGWAAAHEILGRMQGPEVPQGWQGGLPFRYRVTSGRDMYVRMKVVQPRSIQKTSNVIGIVRGAVHPDELVIVGCHFDAWTFGAGDPHAGSIVLFEMARSFAQLAKQGQRPDRTIVFANWGAEEYGIIGSTEWCEANAQRLAAHGVAYVNLDMAAMGPEFRAAAAPALKQVIEGATKRVPQARDPLTTVHAAWARRGKGKITFGNLGGGSDHVGFYCHLGVPSCSLGGGGSRGVSYHSAYDTLHWYRKVVGEDYEPALMLARVGNVLVSRLANAPLVPYDIARPFADAQGHLDDLARGRPLAKRPHLRRAFGELAVKAGAVGDKLRQLVKARELAGDELARANATLLSLERTWLQPRGLPARPWYRNLYAASDPHSGYAAWMLPLLHDGLLPGGRVTPVEALREYLAVLERAKEHLARLEEQMGDRR